MICLNCKKKEISKANKFCDYYGTEIILEEKENEVKVKARRFTNPQLNFHI